MVYYCVDSRIFFVIAETDIDEALKFGVLVCAKVAFLDLAVNVIGVGVVAGAEVLVDGEQRGSGRHSHPLM